MGQRHVCTFRHAQRAAYRTAISTAQILVIIIKSLINSAALKNSDALQAYVIQCCGTGVPSGVVQKLSSTVMKDSGRLVGCSKCLALKQQSSCDRWLWLSDLRCRRPASSTTGWQSSARYGGS